MADASDPQLLQSIQAYVRRESPGQAILIDGDWGSGKTHYAKSVILQGDWHDKVALYVSLFGLNSVAEIEDALCSAILGLKLDEKRSGKLGDFLGGVVDIFQKLPGSSGKAVSVLATAASSLIKRKLLDALGANHLILLDDLERFLGDPRDMLALANRLTEHQGAAVILIGCEAEMPPQFRDTYLRQKEKTVRYSFRFDPDYSAIAAIAVQFKRHPEFEQVLQRHGLSTVTQVARRMRCKNLRTLRFGLEVVEDLFHEYPDPLRQNLEGFPDLVQEALTLAICVKSNRLVLEDLRLFVTDPERVQGLLAGVVLPAQRDMPSAHQQNVASGHPQPVPNAHPPLSDAAALKYFLDREYDYDRFGFPSLWSAVVDGRLDRPKLEAELKQWAAKQVRILSDDIVNIENRDDAVEADRIIQAILQGLRKRDLQFRSPSHLRGLCVSLDLLASQNALGMTLDQFYGLLDGFLATVEQNPLTFFRPQSEWKKCRKVLEASEDVEELPNKARYLEPIERIMAALDAEQARLRFEQKLLQLNQLALSDPSALLQQLENEFPTQPILHLLQEQPLLGWVDRTSPWLLGQIASAFQRRYHPANRAWLRDELPLLRHLQQALKQRIQAAPPGVLNRPRGRWLRALNEVIDALKIH